MAIVDSTLLSMFGIFFLLECIIMNIFLMIGMTVAILLYTLEFKLTNLFHITVMIIFNLIDAQKHSDKEYSNFKDLIRVSRQKTLLSGFVDRLLPKHVSPYKLDTSKSEYGSR
jgi:hypothetical protein